MAERSELTKRLPKRAYRLRRMSDQLEAASHKPYIGLTQGGSSREDAGCRVAATKGIVKQPLGGISYAGAEE